MKYIAASVVIAIVLILGVGMTLPNDYSISRSVVIDAPIETVFDQVHKVRNLTVWSPWAAKDSTIEYQYSDQESGEGAWYSWTSENVGAGRLEVTKVEALQHIEHKLVFEGMPDSHPIWDFEVGPDGVEVTWSFEGVADGPLGGFFAAIMDGMIGPDFELGLKNLQKLVADLPVPAPMPSAVTEANSELTAPSEVTQ